MNDSLHDLPLFSDRSRQPPAADRLAPIAAAPVVTSFVETVQQFNAFGQRTIERDDGGIPYLINEFWTSGQRQAHSIHEISYRACFKPQLPRFFIERLTSPETSAKRLADCALC
jgi:hypothetical protein